MKRGGVRGGKKSGMPSTRASDAAERSPAVYLANLKADLLLQKQKQVLKRAEASLVHRIVIDQKILFRRFQAKLRRSKLARARLWGDKEAERELRARDLHVMNTNCGQEQDDLEFLKKLQRRPCPIDDEPGKPESARKTPEVTDKDMEEFLMAIMEEQVPPPTDKNLRSLSAIGRLIEEVGLDFSAESDSRQSVSRSAPRGSGVIPRITVRPVTTAGPRPDTPDTPSKPWGRRHTSHTDHAPQQGRPPSQRIVARPTQPPSHLTPQSGHKHGKPRPLTSPASSAHRPKLLGTPEPQVPSPVGKPAAAGSLSPTGGSRRPSQATGSMFEESRKVDVVALRLEEARSTDLSPKVGAFLKSLLDLEKKPRARPSSQQQDQQPGDGDEVFHDPAAEPLSEAERGEEEEEKGEELKGDRKFDYYASKMALYAASVKRDPRASLPGTPEEVNMRLVGNYAVRAITMPTLVLDFDLQQFLGQDGGLTGGRGRQQSAGTANVLTVHDM